MTTNKPVLPQSIEVEQAVLGSILIDSEAIDLVMDSLQAIHFYRDAHQIIYRVMCDLAQKREVVDTLTVSDKLEQQGELEAAGGAGYLTDLINSVPTSRNIESYARIVVKKWVYRAIIENSGEAAKLGYNEEENALEQAMQTFAKIEQSTTSRPIMSHRKALTGYITEIQEAYARGDTYPGILTGYPQLDTMLGGLRPSKLYVVGARPGDGKTALALCIADTAVRASWTVLFFSLEMEVNELMQRWVAMTAHIDSARLRDGTLDEHDWESVERAASEINELQGTLLIEDTPGNAMSTIVAKSRQMHASDRAVDLIIVDYLQLVQVGHDDKYENRRLEVEKVSRDLKKLARNLQVPMLALAQLNREAENRADRQPQLSDLREAGGIEQDADVVMLLHKSSEIPKDKPNFPVNVIVEKNRNGQKGKVPLYFKGGETRFYSDDPSIRKLWSVE